MGTYIVDVSSLVSDAGATLELDDDVPLESLTIGDTHAVFDAPPHVRASIMNTGESLALLGRVEVTATLECSRCLEPYSHPLDGALEALFVQPAESTTLAQDEEWYPIAEDGTLDLMPAILAALGLEIPYAPLHSESCKGICPTCGCDRNRDSCTCSESAGSAESPFAVLKDLVESDRDS